MILPVTDVMGAEKVAEQIRVTISQKKMRIKSSGQELGAVTMSIGVSAYIPGEDVTALIERADQGLYEAKHLGRNQVVVKQTRDGIFGCLDRAKLALVLSRLPVIILIV